MKIERVEYATVGYMAKRIQMRKQRFMAIQKIAQEKKLQVDGGQQPSAMMSAGPDHSHSHSSHGHSHSHQHGPKQSVQQSIQGKCAPHLCDLLSRLAFYSLSFSLSSHLFAIQATGHRVSPICSKMLAHAAVH